MIGLRLARRIALRPDLKSRVRLYQRFLMRSRLSINDVREAEGLPKQTDAA